jgi:hypothetical protein
MPEPIEQPTNGVSFNIRVRMQEFKIPPVEDALVLGKDASISCEAMRRSLTLLHVAAFEHIELKGEYEDDRLGDILVRRTVLNKIPRDKLIRLIIDRIKPFMAAEEILHLRVDTEVSLEHQI